MRILMRVSWVSALILIRSFALLPEVELRNEVVLLELREFTQSIGGIQLDGREEARTHTPDLGEAKEGL